MDVLCGTCGSLGYPAFLFIHIVLLLCKELNCYGWLCNEAYWRAEFIKILMGAVKEGQFNIRVGKQFNHVEGGCL
jgi:hypothetical protein